MKTHSPPIKFIGTGAYPLKKLCVVVHREELVKLSSPPLQFTFIKRKTKKLQKSETCIFEDVTLLDI